MTGDRRHINPIIKTAVARHRHRLYHLIISSAIAHINPITRSAIAHIKILDFSGAIVNEDCINQY
ncbi:hypothetical protein WKK05_18950 [Nostoc sp. UHCC 0302]|uniref:hypothetical protein n=1 Tax=Nostoc sp. UHCC 0302 TaxID=3134896 RepID=UPI00311CBE45